VLLKLGLGRRDQLHGNELEATVLEARDDGADESALKDDQVSSVLIRGVQTIEHQQDGHSLIPGHHRA
jgi:hypothetical protein